MGVGYTLGPPRGYRRGAELPGDLGPEGDTHSSDFLEPEVLSLMPKLGGAPTESGGGFVEEGLGGGVEDGARKTGVGRGL